MITSLVYIRRPTKIVLNVRHIDIMRTHSVWRESGFTKFGVTPGGGGRPPIMCVAFECRSMTGADVESRIDSGRWLDGYNSLHVQIDTSENARRGGVVWKWKYQLQVRSWNICRAPGDPAKEFGRKFWRLPKSRESPVWTKPYQKRK